MGNTAILLILRAHMIPYRIDEGVVQVRVCDCVQGDKSATSWVAVPDIVSAMWVVGEL